MKPVILLIDDEQSIQFGYEKYLSKTGYDVHSVSTAAEARSALSIGRIDVVLLDLNLPDGNGIELIPEIRHNNAEMALVVITGAGDIPSAVKAMQLGADHYLTKPIDMAELEIFIRKSLELKTLRKKNNAQLRLDKTDKIYFGTSSAMKRVIEFASVAMGKETALLICGETGTGKGVLAKWIHDQSDRRHGPFVAVNCSSLKGDLLHSELFGHAKGSFTSALQDRSGLLEIADGGTLFLDEIGDMDLGVQAQFLKVIEEKQYRRLGEDRIRNSDFRLICATHRDLLQETKNGRFRLDLYYRINVYPIYLPSLRERIPDLEGLVNHLMEGLNNRQPVTLEIMELLRSYPWPGNIRELRNVLERACLLSSGETLEVEHFPGIHREAVQMSNNQKLRTAEAAHILTIVDQCNGDTIEAAGKLGISRATLYRKIKKMKK